MELKKLVLATAMFSALGGLYGCSGDETVDIVIDAQDNSVSTTTTTTSGGDTSTVNCPESFSFERSVGDRDVCQLNPSILSNVTLTADTPWFLNSAVVIGNGNQEMSATDGILDEDDAPVADVTLTIEPGTEIFGANNSFANITVTRGSRIVANGTATAPIIFSSADEGYDGSGEWGGLIIHGYGLHNECDYVGVGPDAPAEDQPCNVDSEGESGFAGGHDNEDSSGSLQYVIVAEGGFEFAVGNEINGISFVGVGSGTTVENIQVTGNADDGVEFYGGAVNAKYLVLTGNDDDSIDWDEGYIGNIQYALVAHVVDGGDFTIEADTEGTTDFLSEPTILNATFLSSGVEEAAHSMKEGTGGYIHNSIISDIEGGAALDFCVNLTDVADEVTNADLVYNNIVADCVAFETTDGSTASTTLGTATVTVVSDVTFNANWAATNTEASGFAFVEADLNASPVVDVSFFDITTYAGAVDPAATSAWFDGWTLEGTIPTAP
jgi:hypothetical protein